MTPEQDRVLRETLRLAQENNRMLHSMRRNAFLGGIVKFIFYVLILVVAPLWVYTTYLAPLIQNVQETMQQVQGTNAKAQAQLGSVQDLWKSFEAKLPTLPSTSSGQ
jgi:cell division septal protein FtsQ